MDGYDKPIQLDDFNDRSIGANKYDKEEDLMEIPEAQKENERKIDELCGIKAANEPSVIGCGPISHIF